MFTKQDLANDIKAIGIQAGDVVIVHSSFKSLGALENGAETIVGALLEVLGSEGTLVFPTLCQNNWEHVYENWHMDAPSDVGYLTNYFLKLRHAKRSNQATHSVAAIGKMAEYITKTHGETGRIPGPYGDTPFANDSPWEKLYELDAKVLLLGTRPSSITIRHLAEYRVLDKNLQKAKLTDKYEDFKNELWLYERWEQCGVNDMIEPSIILDKTIHLATISKIGDADCKLYSARQFVDICQNAIEKRLDGWRDPERVVKFSDWEDRIDAEVNKKQRQ